MEMKPVSVIKANLGINPGGKIEQFFTETCYRHMDKYVPFRPTSRTHLREEVFLGPNYIDYLVPYAHAQYVGYTTGPVKKWTTPGTGPYWDERMVSAELDQVIEEVQKEVDRNGNKSN